MFCHLEWPQKRTIFQKQIVATKMRIFTFQTQIVFAYFLKMTFVQKKQFFFTTTQKTLLFWAFFEIFLFHVFHIFLFNFSNMKREKQKVHHFFFETLFRHPDKLPKKYFRTPTHYLWLLTYPKNTIKLGKTTKIWDQLLAQPWTKFCLKKPNLGPSFVATAYIYIRCEVNNWAKFGHFQSQ